MADSVSAHPVLSLFTELLVPSPSGREDRLAGIVGKKLKAMDYAFETDAVGNLTVQLEGHQANAGTCMFAAHMDEIAMVVTNVNGDGSLSVSRSGGLNPWKIGEGPVDVLGLGGASIVGVLSMGSAHTLNVRTEAIKWQDCKVLTGLSADDLNSVGIRPGSYVVPTLERRHPVIFGDPADPLTGAWTFDDRMGVVMLLMLLQSIKDKGIQPHHPTIVAFTVQEEIGGHGARVLAQRLEPEIFIAVDGCPMLPGTSLQLDGRPGIWSKDRLAAYDQRLLEDLSVNALQAGTELQPVVYDATASDASCVQTVPRIACVGHVRENSHGFEVARLSVFDNVINTLVQFVESWEG